LFITMDRLGYDYNEMAPYVRNCLTIYGQFWSGTIYQGQRPLILTRYMQWVLTFLGCLGGGLAVARAWERRRELVTQPLFLFTVVHLVVLALSPIVYDRYFLVLFPGGLAAVTGGPVGYRRAGMVVAALLVFAVLSFAIVRDFLTWNSAVWELGRRAVARGTNPEDIEGGFGWDGSHCPTEDKKKNDRDPLRLTLPFTRQYFPTVEGRYAVSFTELPETRILDRQPYHLWLSPGPRQLFYLEYLPDSPLLKGASTVGILVTPSGYNPLLATTTVNAEDLQSPALP
jgi:hypothetical protein